MVRAEKKLLVLFITTAIVLAGCSAQSLIDADFPVPSKILDANGKVITTVDEENRIPVSLDNISSYMQQAIVAIEDSRFYQHNGVDPVGLARALWRNIETRSIVEGGSTISQQLVKNLYLGPERTVGRKIQEVFLTIQLERKHTKDEILEMYLNQIYFGQGAYGVEAAARTYFNKPAKDLGLAESAMLAGVPRAPSIYAPSRNFEGAKARQATVLNRMVELGMISPEQAQQAGGQYLEPSKVPVSVRKAPYFTNEIMNYIETNYPNGLETLYSGGLSIYTTLDLNMQEAAEKAVSQGLKGSDRELDGALVAVDPKTGQVKAMVGGKDYARSQLNRAVARFQPGSAFKPFLYAAAIDSGYTPGSTITCEPVSFPQTGGARYEPHDYQGGYHNRPFTLKEALYTSDNVVAVRLTNQVGADKVANYARRMGVESPLRPVLSLPLGTSEVTPLELASAYIPLANRGIKAEPYFIQKITDRNGRILEEHKPKLEQAIDEKTAYIVTDILTAVLKPGGTAPNIDAAVGRPAAGKTGTTENLKEAWFVGYTPDLVAAVYIGYDDKNKVTGQTGAQIAAPIWASFAKAALNNVPISNFTMPNGVIKVNICAEDGLLAGPLTPRSIEAAFIQGTEPIAVCPGSGGGLLIPEDIVQEKYRPGSFLLPGLNMVIP
jgi:1A family penicillin-binding protein